jgi:hypothetical protein
LGRDEKGRFLVPKFPVSRKDKEPASWPALLISRVRILRNWKPGTGNCSYPNHSLGQSLCCFAASMTHCCVC